MDIIETLERQLKEEAAASYFMGKYYFKVNTGKYRHEFELSPGTEITTEVQRSLQRMNLIPMFHEYIHYIHDISTVVGSMSLHLDIGLKAAFSFYFSKDLKSCEHHGIDLRDKEQLKIFSAFHTSMESINGSVLQGVKMLKVEGISYKHASIEFYDGTSLSSLPFKIPEIEVVLHENGTYKNEKILFGKFFLFEGLAYELDRIIDKQVFQRGDILDDMKLTEYTLLRLLAKHIYPDISTEAFLTAASLSLSSHSCGEEFVKYVEKIKSQAQKGMAETDILNRLKLDTSASLIERIVEYDEAQDELPIVFENREQLHKAFTAVVNEMKRGYLMRAKRPAFEVEYIFSGQFAELLNLVSICDYMYVFKDDYKFDRDILGTASFSDEVSQALKVLIVLDHYQKSHGLKSTKQVEHSGHTECPFFTVCNLELRKVHEHICKESPWRIFDISAATDNRYCWYGTGVGESKGHSQISDIKDRLD